jgi:hypothetical protein
MLAAIGEPIECMNNNAWQHARARAAERYTHHSAVELAELINAVNKIDRSLATPAITLLRAAA